MTIESSLERLDKDLIAAAKLMTAQEIRYMVDTYYAMQKFRIGASNEDRALGEIG